jgi:hypothetical protein
MRLLGRKVAPNQSSPAAPNKDNRKIISNPEDEITFIKQGPDKLTDQREIIVELVQKGSFFAQAAISHSCKKHYFMHLLHKLLFFIFMSWKLPQ